MRPVWAKGPVSDSVWPILIGVPDGACAINGRAAARAASPPIPATTSRRETIGVFLLIASSPVAAGAFVFGAPAVLGNHLSQKAGPHGKNFAAGPVRRGCRAAANGRARSSPIPGSYFFFATTLVTRLPIAGDFISIVSPGFR